MRYNVLYSLNSLTAAVHKFKNYQHTQTARLIVMCHIYSFLFTFREKIGTHFFNTSITINNTMNTMTIVYIAITVFSFGMKHLDIL